MTWWALICFDSGILVQALSCFRKLVLIISGMLRVALCGGLLALATLKGCEDHVSYPPCSSYSKGGLAAIMDASSCDHACDKGEGFRATKYGSHEFKGSSGMGKCECIISGGARKTACQDLDYPNWERVLMSQDQSLSWFLPRTCKQECKLAAAGFGCSPLMNQGKLCSSSSKWMLLRNHVLNCMKRGGKEGAPIQRS